MFLEGKSQDFSLESAIQYAIEHSTELQRDALTVRDAEAQLKEYKAIGIPKVSGNIDYQYNFEIGSQPTQDFITPAVIGILNQNNVTPQPIPLPELETFNIAFGQRHNFGAGIGLETLIFDGSYLVGLKAQELYRDLVQKDKDQTEYEIRSAVTKAYVNVLINERLKSIYEKNIDNIKITLSETNEIYKAGFIEKLDVDRLQLSLDNLKTDLANVERIISLSENLLKYQMIYPIEEPISLNDDMDSLLDDEEIKDAILTQLKYNERPEYRILQKSEELNAINVKRLQKRNLPTVRAYGNINRSLQDDNFILGENKWISSSAVGMGIHVPIYDAGDRKAKVERARIDLERNKLQIQDFERAMNLQVSNAWMAYQNALNNRESRENTMALAQHIYDIALEKYREGVGASVEVRQAELDFFASEREYISALYDVLSTKIDLEIALGKI